MLKISSYFIAAVYKCLQTNRKMHIKHIFSNKKALQREREIEREISSAYHSTTYLNIMCT